jgi:hypothetical protein
MRARILLSALIVAASLSTAAFGQGAPRVVVGDNPSLSGAPLYVALGTTARPASTCSWR